MEGHRLGRAAPGSSRSLPCPHPFTADLKPLRRGRSRGCRRRGQPRVRGRMSKFLDGYDYRVAQTTLPVDLGILTEQVFAAVLFDMDGTLIDSTPAVERSWISWGKEYNLTP